MPKSDRVSKNAPIADGLQAVSLEGGRNIPLRMWVRLVSCYHLMEIRLRKELRTNFDNTLPRFDLMAQLYRYPKGLKMKDLSRLLMVTCGNITGMTDRLVDEGLIQRLDDPNDRRAYQVGLTPKGRKLFQKMAVQHERWITSLLGDLDQTELHQIHDLLGKLKLHLSAQSQAA